MPLWLLLVDSLALVTACVIGLIGTLIVRRRVVAGRRRTFDLSVCRQAGPTTQGWVIGVGTYGANSLDWYRTFSLAWWPRYRFSRGDLVVLERRDPVGSEAFALDDGDVIVNVQHPSGVRQLAMSPSALTGLLAWLESSPPGHRINNVL